MTYKLELFILFLSLDEWHILLKAPQLPREAAILLFYSSPVDLAFAFLV